MHRLPSDESISPAPSAASGPGRVIHIVGVGGSATSGLARILCARGYRVSGSDREEGGALAALRAAGIPATAGHDRRHLPPQTEVVVHSAAVPTHNEELAEARARGLTIQKYAHFLGELVADRFGIAVAGTHGKTSTAGMLTSIYLAAGRDPDVLIGGVHPDLGANYRVGGDAEFIVEACEYDRSFHAFRPRAGILTNLELDHPDIYTDDALLFEAFEQYLAGFAPDGVVVVNRDCPGVRQLRFANPSLRRVDFAWGSDATWGLEGWRPGAQPRFEVFYRGRPEASIELRVPGRHSATNALAAYALARELGLRPEAIARGLSEFPGIERRFHYHGAPGGVHVIDDYAHHPTEVECVISAARDAFPGARVIAGFQPHQYGRVQAFRARFARALATADAVFLAPVFSVRERPEDFDPQLIPQLVADIERGGTPCHRLATLEATGETLCRETQPGDVCLLLGAGDLVEVLPELELRLASAREQRPGVSA